MAITYAILDRKRLEVAKDVAFRATQCCARAATAVSTFDSTTTAAFKKWFGFVAEKDAKDQHGKVPSVIERMNYYLTSLPLNIIDAGSTLGPNTNAEATHYGDKQTRSYQDRATTAANAAVQIALTDRFFNQLTRVQSNDQTQIETFIHELSHVAAGVLDQDHHATNPLACYGRVNALAMATSHPDQARDNAENYGFFIAEVGGEIPLASIPAPAGSGKKWATVGAPHLVR